MSTNGKQPNAAQLMQRFAHMPPLEVQSMQACENIIKEALVKYGCILVFEQILHNGMPVGGGFQVVKKPSGAQPQAMPNPIEPAAPDALLNDNPHGHSNRSTE
jgi:hypothetical protein